MIPTIMKPMWSGKHSSLSARIDSVDSATDITV